MHWFWQIWLDLRSSLWFVPASIVVGAIALAAALVEIDARISDDLLVRWPRLFGAGAEGSRSMLSQIAGSMITVAGVTFSITIAALAQTSSQYTSRVLRTFMSNRPNQVVLGVFVGIFVYCLVVLRTIRGGEESFVPSLSVATAVLLALVGVGFLIFFIHHIATSIQASTILAVIFDETTRAIDRLFPQELGSTEGSVRPDAGTTERGATWSMVGSPATGYIQGLDGDALVAAARDSAVVIRMERSIGDFVVQGGPLASVSGGDAGADTAEAIRRAFAIGRHRTVEQDAAFGIRQIVDIALKALSPGINDPTTAMMCVDYLSAILSRLAGRYIPPACRFDGDDLRLIALGPDFESLVDASFDQIRRNAESDVAVLRHMLAAIGTVAGSIDDRIRLGVLARHAQMIGEAATRALPTRRDREEVLGAVDRLVSAAHEVRGTS